VNAVSYSNTIEVDARGLRCPLPVIRLAEAAHDAPSGTWVVVLASDPAARHDIPAWCRMRNHELVEITEIVTNPENPENTENREPGQTWPSLRFVILLRA
jgi:tRNA 2-thiouridine synthesizing protein A